jgi:hypothetical protein
MSPGDLALASRFVLAGFLREEPAWPPAHGNEL